MSVRDKTGLPGEAGGALNLEAGWQYMWVQRDTRKQHRRYCSPINLLLRWASSSKQLLDHNCNYLYSRYIKTLLQSNKSVPYKHAQGMMLAACIRLTRKRQHKFDNQQWNIDIVPLLCFAASSETEGALGRHSTGSDPPTTQVDLTSEVPTLSSPDKGSQCTLKASAHLSELAPLHDVCPEV